MSSVAEALRKRKSVRRFLRDKPVPLPLVRSILELASRAPSGGNTQPWHVYVVTGDLKQELTNEVLKKFNDGIVMEPPEFSMYPAKEASAKYMERRRRLGFAMVSRVGFWDFISLSLSLSYLHLSPSPSFYVLPLDVPFSNLYLYSPLPHLYLNLPPLQTLSSLLSSTN